MKRARRYLATASAGFVAGLPLGHRAGSNVLNSGMIIDFFLHFHIGENFHFSVGPA